MKKLTAVLLGALSSLPVLGQDLLECVNPDVLKGVLFNGRPEAQMTVTAALPAPLAGYEAPAAFELVGSAARGGGTTVAFRTSLDREAAYAALLASFEADGWVVEEPTTLTAPIFILDRAPVSGTICLDRERRSLNVEDVNGQRYASIGLTDQPTTQACNARNPRRSVGLGMMSRLTGEAPTLELPEGTTAADGSGRINTGGSGSGDSYSTDSRIRSPLPASSFMEGLAAQMSAQGWNADARWSGTLSSGGRWIRMTGDGIMYWSTLEIVDVGDGIYDLSFRMMMPPR